ncbi:MAG: lipid-A-disaccharide synthase [Gammaproteobacteria bacterium]|nr:MAG: lipid-A-disaccharide synthase [Gammaproteobacteria bacterium]
MVVAGEASGDLHAASVVRAMKAQHPGLTFYGMGGKHMAKAGVDVRWDIDAMAVMGLVEVLAELPTLYKTFLKVKRDIQRHPPDLLLLVDYPDFNLRLAKAAKRAGVKVLYYISPQVWAWRSGRVKKIRRYVDHMAVIFPFEVPFYQRAGVPVSFVGHPLLDHPRAEGMPKGPGKTVGLFPGSRRQEIRHMLPLFQEAAGLIAERHPETQFLLPLASTLSRGDVLPYLKSDPPVQVVFGGGQRVIPLCDAIITASGTATLEIALHGVPMVIAHRVSRLSYLLLKRLVKVEHIGLCNLVAGESVAPELIQDQATPEAIAEALLSLVSRAEETRRGLQRVRARLGEPGAAERVASLALEMAGAKAKSASSASRGISPITT